MIHDHRTFQNEVIQPNKAAVYSLLEQVDKLKRRTPANTNDARVSSLFAPCCCAEGDSSERRPFFSSSKASIINALRASRHLTGRQNKIFENALASATWNHQEYISELDEAIAKNERLASTLWLVFSFFQNQLQSNRIKAEFTRIFPSSNLGLKPLSPSDMERLQARIRNVCGFAEHSAQLTKAQKTEFKQQYDEYKKDPDFKLEISLIDIGALVRELEAIPKKERGIYTLLIDGIKDELGSKKE